MSSPVYLDFVRDRRHRALLGTTFLGAALAAGAALLVWFTALGSALESTGQSAAAYARHVMPPLAVTANLEPEEAKKLMAGLHQLVTPWENLLGAVESAASSDVAVLSLQQDPAQNSLKIAAEARDVTAMLEYVRRLGVADRIESATIENHRIDLRQPERPVRFSVTARYSAQRP